MFYEIHERMIAEHFEELNALRVPFRQSRILQLYMEEIPIQIRPDDLIAGWYGYESAPEPLAAPAPRFPFDPVMTDAERAIYARMEQDLKIEIHFNAAHTCIDYQTVVEKGLAHYIGKVKAALAETPDQEFLQAMLMDLNTVIGYAHRFAALAKAQADRAASEADRARLTRMHETLMKVPEFPADSFYEAIQSIWILHSAIPIAEQAWYSISVGRMDQYLYPLYQKAIAGGTTDRQIIDLLKNLFLLFDNYGDGSNALNIGGMDADGNDMTNGLSRVIIQAEKESALRSPILAVRVNPNTPDDVLDSVIDFDLFKIGQPTFYGELPCRKAVEKRGVSPAESCRFSANSCMGLMIPGREFADMWGIKFNTHLPLELAVNGGRPFHCDMPFPLKTQPKPIDSFQTLMEQYGLYLDEILTECTRYYKMVALETERNRPDPMLSALIDGCVEQRRDRSIAAVYNSVTVETMGMVNTCDALEAIRSLVFARKKYTLDQLVAAAKDNYENAPVLLHDLRACSKYGMNDANSNAICKELAAQISRVCSAASTAQMPFMPSLHTIDANVSYGAGLYATLDGRQQGDPVNKNADPSALLTRLEHTSQILSAVAFDQTDFGGGQPIDLYFDKAWFETKQMRDKIKSLILTYFQLGGLQMQVNSVDIELLEKAHRSPEDYPQVIIRKGGYSLRFNELPFDVRADFIAQAKKTSA